MEILFAGGAFLGVTLGRFFRIFVLIPVMGLLIVLALLKMALLGMPTLSSAVKLASLLFCLEVGYMAGLASTGVRLLSRHLRLP